MKYIKTYKKLNNLKKYIILKLDDEAVVVEIIKSNFIMVTFLELYSYTKNTTTKLPKDRESILSIDTFNDLLAYTTDDINDAKEKAPLLFNTSKYNI